MMNFIAGPAKFKMFQGNQLIATGKTNIDSSIAIGSSNEEVRAGDGNALYGKYYHTSTFDVALTEVMFKLEYLAMQTGSTIVNGGNLYTTEQVTLTQGGAGTVSKTPVAFGTYGNIGWASKVGSDDVQIVNFTGSSFEISGANTGDVYCVTYVTTDVSARSITVSSAFVPATVRLVLTANLYAGDASTSVGAANSTLSGEVQIEIPRFQFNGTADISMTSTGVANTPLNGSALATSSADCNGVGYYAVITEKLFGANWYDNVYAIAVSGGQLNMEMSATETLVVRALPTSGAAFIVPGNTGLTFTSKSDAIATVTNAGVVNAVSAGNTAITVTITGKPSVETAVGVIVNNPN